MPALRLLWNWTFGGQFLKPKFEQKTCNFAVYQTFLQLFGAKKFGEIRLRNRPLEENLNFVISEFPSDLIVIQLLRHDHGTDGWLPSDCEQLSSHGRLGILRTGSWVPGDGFGLEHWGFLDGGCIFCDVTQILSQFFWFVFWRWSFDSESELWDIKMIKNIYKIE